MVDEENPFERRARAREAEARGNKSAEEAQAQKLLDQTHRVAMYAQQYAANHGRPTLEWNVTGHVVTATAHSGSVFRVTVLDTDTFRVQRGDGHTAEGDMDRLADEFHEWLEDT
jgi:hypothetical protein